MRRRCRCSCKATRPATSCCVHSARPATRYLLGTGSFWEGVDVKGTALSVVIIDKLPFAVPDDPLLKARLAAIRAQGGNPFFDEQVPQAVIALKQGVGRLIRDAGRLRRRDALRPAPRYQGLWPDLHPEPAADEADAGTCGGAGVPAGAARGGDRG